MQRALSHGPCEVAGTFEHEAYFYAGLDEFVSSSAAFIREGIAENANILVVVSPLKIARLREELGGQAEAVSFADMTQVGHNPARIIPAWHDFVDMHAASGRPLRGIGEPIGPGSAPPHLAECHRHEALLNLAFHETPEFWLRCPYDVDALAPEVIDEAERNHPVVTRFGKLADSPAYHGLDAIRGPFTEPLAPPPAGARELPFTADMLAAVRAVVAEHARAFGLEDSKCRDLLLAISELAANSVRHGGGTGIARIWPDGETLVCEVADGGVFDRPLAGRARPAPGQVGGYGLWLANQLCDLAQVRSTPEGTVVRVHMQRA